MAEQLVFEQRFGQRRAVESDERLDGAALTAWIARATSSLPVPVSPVISTVPGRRRARGSGPSRAPSRAGARSARRAIPADRPAAAAGRPAAASCRRSVAERTRISSSSRKNGFCTKSTAPSFIASTAVSTVPNPVMMMKAESTRRSRSCAQDIEAGDARHPHVGQDHVEGAAAGQSNPSSPLAAACTPYPPPAASAPCCRGRRDRRRSGESATSALNLASPAADTADMKTSSRVPWCWRRSC